MADKSVGELIAAQSVTPTDLFVLEQNGVAKKLTGQTLENWLVSFADGHGGIQNINKVITSGLADTYRITLADTTFYDFVVTNGRGVSSIQKTSTRGLVDTYTIYYNDGSTGTFTVTNGEKGDKGDNAYLWIKFASQQPTASSNSFGDVPDDWIGIYFGGMEKAPTDWQQYIWYKIKGEKGDTGAPAMLNASSVTYQAGDSGTIIPSGTWNSTIPTVSQGKYLWTRQVIQFNTGEPITVYSVARFGIDGAGSVSQVAGISPDPTGNVPLKAIDIGALPDSGGEMSGPIDMNGQRLFGLSAPVENTEAATKGYVLNLAKKAAPRNMLDNSDFRNPVNQRNVSYTGLPGYSIDRWFFNPTGEGYLTVQNGVVQIKAETGSYIDLFQIQEKSEAIKGKAMTLAANFDGYGTVLMNFSYGTDGTVVTEDNKLALIHFGGDRVYIRSFSEDWVSVNWVALYEGEYSSETIPEYQPKGYGTELLECMRYYQIHSSEDVQAVDMRPVMRLTDPTVTEVTDGYAYSADL